MTFGDHGNFRKEKLDFEVVDWPSQYNAILGRTAFARFMAVPHYAYLVLKMPGTKGIITVYRNYKKSTTATSSSTKYRSRSAHSKNSMR